MTVSEKIADIIFTMSELGMIDLKRAVVDPEYTCERVNMYLEAKALATDCFKAAGFPV